MSDKFIYIESPDSPLAECDYDEIKKTAINPLTNKPYKGIILEGIFADLSNEHKNNNNRYYDVPLYLKLLTEFREKVHSKKGVFGELEHPNSYAVNFNNVSHKILDVWYDENTKLVKGYVILLNTEKGKICQEIIKSGGCLAISARAAGDEIEQSDGSLMAKVSLLTTYDLVYHPGFSDAIMEFKELNESFNLGINNNLSGFSIILKDKELKNIDGYYKNYISSNSKPDKCFMRWLSESEQIDTKKKNKEDIKVLEKGDIPNQNKSEEKLKICSDKELKQSAKKLRINQNKTLNKIMSKKYGYIENEPLFDDSAGFMTYGIDTDISSPMITE